MHVVGLAVTALAAILSAAPPTDPPSAKRPRPSEAPPGAAVTAVAPTRLTLYNDYASPERTFSSRCCVVHYVVLGIDAPPLNDDDRDEVPDYVERIAEAADAAVAYYRGRGFQPIQPDEGGPDRRPDLYVSRFSPGLLGVAFPSADAEGGAFAAVSNGLDPSAGVSFASVYGTVAHELFHLVQFSYFRRDEYPAIPVWALEGSAAAMERRVFPELADGVSGIQARRWLMAPERSLVTQSYGSQLLWRWLDGRLPRLLPAYLSRLAARPVAGDGLSAFATTYEHVAGGPFGPAFHAFALETAADHGDALLPYRTLAPEGGYRAALAPAAIHFVRLALPRKGPYELTVRFARRPSPSVGASVVYSLASAAAGMPSALHEVAPRIAAAGRLVTFALPAGFNGSERVCCPLLVVSNGGAERDVHYRVGARSHGR